MNRRLRIFFNVLASLVCLLSTIPLAHAGYIKDWVNSRGGCHSGTASMLFSSIIPGASFLKRAPSDWGDESLVDEFRSVLRACANADPALLTGHIRPTPDQVDAAIDRHVDDFRRILVAPAINAKKIAIEQEEARTRMADGESRRRQEQIAEQIRRDARAAQDAARRATEEAPKIAELQQKAEEARRARIEAERQRDENRKRLDTLEQSAKEDAAAAKRAIAQENAETKAAIDRTDRALLDKPCRVSLDQFRRAQIGSSLIGVERLFGCPGKEVSSSEEMTIYTWDGSETFSQVFGTFIRGRLDKKDQSGLQ